MTRIAVCTPYYDTNCKMWFAESLAKTVWPRESDVQFLKTCGMWIPNALKLMVEKSLEMGADWIVVISSDVGWYSNDIAKLISHNLPIVGGWASGRFHPFTCHVADFIDVDTRRLRPVRNPKERRGIEEVCGNGGELIVYRADVFKTIPSPWFFGSEMVDGDRMMS